MNLIFISQRLNFNSVHIPRFNFKYNFIIAIIEFFKVERCLIFIKGAWYIWSLFYITYSKFDLNQTFLQFELVWIQNQYKLLLYVPFRVLFNRFYLLFEPTCFAHGQCRELNQYNRLGLLLLCQLYLWYSFEQPHFL